MAHHLLMLGNQGSDVDRLRKALAQVLGADAAAFAVLAQPGTPIDSEFDAAIRRWQAGIGVIADGIVGPRCQVLLGLAPAVPLTLDTEALNVGVVCRLFPSTKPANIARYLPYVEAALGAAELTDRAMVLGALGTIRAETEGFVPISEYQSKYNTPPGGVPFSLYDTRHDIGNSERGDGARYRGRGFVQLTGKSNYQTYQKRLETSLVATPDIANAPEVAAVVLAQFLLDKAGRFRAAVAAGDLRAARRLVNGGSHGLAMFKDVFDRADTLWPAATRTPARAAGGKRRAASDVAPVTAPGTETASTLPVRTSRTRKDAADLRDREFQPQALSLPDVYPPQSEVTASLSTYTAAGMILDQGQEGACTGFGLACVINYLRWLKDAGTHGGKLSDKVDPVSPRMLYTLARRHDEYEGENYDGSSCRGALKGWFNNGVCLESYWPYEPEKSNPARYGFADNAAQQTLGVYYRVDTKSITDMQAAIAQHRAIFVSAFTHGGWQQLPRQTKAQLQKISHASLPMIGFDGRPSQTDGHAFALVGFNANGFILQNSWGTSWGAGGFAVLSYLDWLANGMDAWVASLGVPGVVAGRLAVDSGAGRALAGGTDRSKWWDSGLAYQHSVVLGNDGRVSRYLTEDEQPRKLQQQVYALPDAWFRSQPAQQPKRLVLYVHGGLNSEEAAIKRASAMGRFFIGNGCYPIFLVWKTGLLESVGNIFADKVGLQPALAGSLREAITDRTDTLVEKTIGRPLAKPLWSEMKENAQLAFTPRHGGDLLLDALQALTATWGEAFELHLVGHSAGALALGHLLQALFVRQQAGRDGNLGKRMASVHLYAPACSVAFANLHYASNPAVMERLHLDVLSDKQERGDTVTPIYRKSLLYFVSNALEADLHTPLLGMERIQDTSDTGWDGTSDTGESLLAWRTAAQATKLKGRTSMVSNDNVTVAIDALGQAVMAPAAHGSFDNDIAVVGRTLERITGAPLTMPVDDLRGY